MANTKNSSAREIILDRLLNHRCGYSVYELCDMVNRSLQLEGYRPVSTNTIRNDLANIRNQYKRSLHVETRRNLKKYRYEDQDSTIFTNVLTNGELQHLHSALMSIRFVDPLQGTLIYDELSEQLADMLDVDSSSDPIVLYKKIPTKADCSRFKALYHHIRTKKPAIITCKPADGAAEEEILVHPYFILFDCPHYYLLCHDATNGGPAKINIQTITRMVTEADIEYIPNKDFPLQDFYAKHLSRG